jgi:hypothetical protein
MNKKVIASIVLVIVVVSVLGLYEFSVYEQGVVQTSVVMGTVTSVQASGPQAAGGLFAAAGAKKAASSGVSIITITVGSVSFTQVLGCGTLPAYNGETVQVADQLLRSGQHQYLPDIACKGSVSPFKSLHITSTSSTSALT